MSAQTAAKAPAPWICEICGNPIAWPDTGGAIELRDRRSYEMPDYDPDAPEDTTARGDRGEILADETAKLQVAAAIRLLDDPGVEMHVWHYDCADAARHTDYQIDCTSALTIEAWAGWITHLGQKNWIKRKDLVGLIRLWCRGHGLTIRDDLL